VGLPQSAATERGYLDGSAFDRLAQSLMTSPSRRAAVRLLAGLLMIGPWRGVSDAPVALAKRKKRKKKKCKGGKKKCGKGCCGVTNLCASGICFCSGDEPQGSAKCVDVAAILIEIIAEETGIAPGIIGANPEDPLEEQVTIDEIEREAIDKQIKETFGVAEEVPYYTEGIAAAAAAIREELQKKG
jgi:hypothetical protein